MPSNKKNKSKNAHNNNNNNNSRNKNHKADLVKSKKEAESEEFEKVLADLSRVTEAVGLERAKQAEREEKMREEREKRHKSVLEKTNDAEEEFHMQLRRKQKTQQFQQLLQQLLSAQRPFLDAPNTEFHSETVCQNPNFDVAVGEMQGWRLNMEDEHVIDVTFPNGAEDSKEGLFCVFDGHSGKECATKCREWFPKIARAHITKRADDTTVVDFDSMYMQIDKLLEAQLGDDSGCTAVTVHITPDFITCASVGDSRAVLCRSGAAFALAHDHKPENADERARIEAAGGAVSENRVNGQLAMSRAMGDFSYKQQKERDAREQLVIAVPDVIQTPREAGDAFVVLACDGIFDVLTNEELVEIVLMKKSEGKNNTQICEEICRECLAPVSEDTGRIARAEGTDNMTIMIVDLK
ncbi:PPM-type phosphatase domain [Trypanosoma melophagium]|uniref:PPM-type phosphatase domain n=1 Tax=Trypanosoma melophagium TaxID=715481 RepID=UPI003519F66A|nr:PPM-type phosphatase domain [Trypanosoma melophagium]